MMSLSRAGLMALLVSLALLPIAIATGREAAPPVPLRPASAFASIADPSARSVAIFTEMGKVITSPRCVNCHPRTDRPLQGDAGMPHNPPVLRGADGHGVAGLECATCHGAANFTYANGSGSIPGAPKWALAPLSMAWEGKTIGQICVQIKDPKRNGGKSLADLIEHNGKDELVGWGWHPGFGRNPAPGTQAEFGALTQAWVDSGAKCPA